MMKMDINLLIARTLRIGVSLACLVAFIGGVLYLAQHGQDPFEIEVYRHFSYDVAHDAAYTTLHGILGGLWQGTAVGWIQTGVLLLLLTPVMRVLLSLFDFVSERDWLYAGITAAVLTVILLNSVGGRA